MIWGYPYFWKHPSGQLAIIYPSSSHHVPPISSPDPPGGTRPRVVEVSEDLVQRIWSDVDQSAEGAVNLSCNPV